MKPFGRFLVELALISDEQLLQALVRQQESLPGVAAIVQETELLPVDAQLKIFKRQWDTGGEYRRAALELGYWSDRIQHEVKRRLVEARRPLGQVLVEAEVLTIAQLTNALDEYIGISKSEAAPKPPPPSAAPAPETRAESAGPYCQLFDEDMHFRLKEALERGVEGADQLAALVRPLAFLARFLGLEQSAAAWAKFQIHADAATLDQLWRTRLTLIERNAA